MAFHQRKDGIRFFISQYGPNGNINVKTDWIQRKANKRIALYPCCVLSSGQQWSRGSKDKPFVRERFVDGDVSRRKSPNGSSSQLHFVVSERKKAKEGKKECCHPQRSMLGPVKTGLWLMLTWDPPTPLPEHTRTHHHTHNLLTSLCSQDKSWRNSQTSTGGSSRTTYLPSKRIPTKTSGSPYFLCVCQLLSFHSTFDNAVQTQEQGQSFPLA